MKHSEKGLERFLPGVPAPADHFYRLVDQRYAEQIDEIGPSFEGGGRYNPSGEFGVLYLTSSPECGFLEKLRRFGGRREWVPPQVVGTFRVHLSKCLNLMDSKVLEKLGLTREDIVDPSDYRTPQTLSRQARKAGFDALLVPAATRETCLNVVVFKDRLLPPAYCRLEVTTPYLF